MSTEQCELLWELAHNVEYQCLIVVKCALCLLGASGIAYQWCKQGVRFLVHDNTKVVFSFFYALQFFLSIGFASVYGIEFVRLRFDCYVVNFRTILLTRGLSICGLIAAHHVIMIISFERLYAALFPAHFEKYSNKKLAAFLSIAVMFSFGLYTMSCLSNRFTLFGDLEVAFFDERIAENSKTHEEMVLVASTSNVLSLFMFSSDLYLNFIRKPEENSTLSISYQRAENRRVLLIILPIEITESCLNLVTTATLFCQAAFQLVDMSIHIHQQIFLELATLPSVMFPAVIALIIELRVARRTRTLVATTNQDVEHFERLRRAWGA